MSPYLVTLIHILPYSTIMCCQACKQSSATLSREAMLLSRRAHLSYKAVLKTILTVYL